jgi:hypothetical protein
MQPGIAALTCAAQQTDASSNSVPAANAFPFGLVDLRNPSPVPHYTTLGSGAILWNPPMYHHPDWSVDKIGCVFGIAVDRDGNIYLAAHSLYVPFWGPPWFGNPYLMLGSLAGPNPTNASGTIYRVDALTGNVTVFAVLPQQADPNLPWNPAAGPGIGNLTYDPAHDQFFATNLEDGKIYRLTKSGITGVIAEVYDPLAPDNGLPGMPPLGDRLWAIEVSGTNVFYSVWNVGNASNPTLIRSVGIAPSGSLVPSSDTLVLSVPGSSAASPGFVTVPVSDLSFTLDGKTMILAERGMFKSSGTNVYLDYYATGNHNSRVLRAAWSGSAWTVTHLVAPGKNSLAGESYGGADFGPEKGVAEALVWMSSADMATGWGPHGIQGLRMVDFPSFPLLTNVANSYLVPYDPAYTATKGPDVKGIGGDVEIMPERACSRMTVRSVACPEKAGQPFTLNVQVQNLSGQTVQYGFWSPCPTNTLPPGATTAQPQPTGVFPLPGGALTNQGTVNLNVQLPGNLGGQTVCFLLTLLDDQGQVCCTQKVCVELPVCDCARITPKIECKPLPDGTLQYTITLNVFNQTHLSANPFPFHYVSFVPPGTFSPNPAPVSPPIPPGGSGTVSVTYTGLPGTLCVHVGFHDADIEPCCFVPLCLELPDCLVYPPDTCAVPEVVLCKQNPATGVATATINYTICNNSPSPQTYLWSIGGTLSGACTNLLGPGAFSPAGGTVTVPGNTCTNIPITVTCTNLGPGQCAGFEVCFRRKTEPPLPEICCRGIIRRSKIPVDVSVGVELTPGWPVLEAGARVELPLRLTNLDDRARRLTLLVYAPRDHGLLLFEDPDLPGVPLPMIHLQGDALPFGTGEVKFAVRSLGGQPREPHVAQVAVLLAEGHLSPEEMVGEEPLLTVPIILPASTQGRLAESPRFLAIRYEAGVQPIAVFEIAVQPGQRYRLEKAPTVMGPWSPAEDLGGKTRDGEFVADQAVVNCRVACEPAPSTQFFRLRVD